MLMLVLQRSARSCSKSPHAEERRSGEGCSLEHGWLLTMVGLRGHSLGTVVMESRNVS